MHVLALRGSNNVIGNPLSAEVDGKLRIAVHACMWYRYQYIYISIYIYKYIYI